MKHTRYILTTFIVMTAVIILAGGCGRKAAAPQPQSQNNTSSQAGSTDQWSQPKQMHWDNPPKMQIDKNKQYSALVSTSDGSFTIQLYAKSAPITVNNFVFLSKQGYFHNVLFHRIIQSFMIQTGDPTGTGAGGPGYHFQDELPSPYKYAPGIVAMANAGPNTNGSQFFICTGPDSKGLNNQPNYTIFGKVTSGMDVVQKIAATPVTMSSAGEKSKPTKKVWIKSVTISDK